MDCFGDGNHSPDTLADVAYPNENLIYDNCINKESCYIANTLIYDDNGIVMNGTWSACSNDDDASCIIESTIPMNNPGAKFKALMLCA